MHSAKYEHSDAIRESGVHIVPCDKFHRIGGAPLETFLMLSMMPLKMWVATENVFTALLGN